jgi:hypothetical protein
MLDLRILDLHLENLYHGTLTVAVVGGSISVRQDRDPTLRWI